MITNDKKELTEYKEIALQVAKAAHEQAKEFESALGITYTEALCLLQVITMDKLTYGLAQILSSPDNRSAVDEEPISKDTPIQ
jgi:hypothetical protein